MFEDFSLACVAVAECSPVHNLIKNERKRSGKHGVTEPMLWEKG
jgi:hypothetical protein